jgi:hypothetical protein
VFFIELRREVNLLASIIIPANKSITLSDKLPDGNIKEDILLVGSDGINKYISYLFFDISNIPSNVAVTYAELVMFKANNFYNDSSKVFGVYPCSYFSSYSTYNNRPQIDACNPTYFYPITSQVHVKAVITYIISAWLNNAKRSNCLMLFGKNNDIFSTFGSATSKDSYLIPFLKINFTPIPQKPIFINYTTPTNPNTPVNTGIPSVEEVQVTGTVAVNAKYNALINVAVKRQATGNTDNYYVVDEYDNTGKNIPLNIDRTYSITINPKPNPGDKETVTFSGSYSE